MLSWSIFTTLLELILSEIHDIGSAALRAAKERLEFGRAKRKETRGNAIVAEQSSLRGKNFCPPMNFPRFAGQEIAGSEKVKEKRVEITLNPFVMILFGHYFPS